MVNKEEKGDSNVQIGEKIREARKAVKMSQADLAQKLGYESATAISLIEAGERNVKAEDLQKAAEIFHRDIAYFVGHESRRVDIKMALRADKDLSEADKKAVLHFIELAKKKRGR